MLNVKVNVQYCTEISCQLKKTSNNNNNNNNNNINNNNETVNK